MFSTDLATTTGRAARWLAIQALKSSWREREGCRWTGRNAREQSERRSVPPFIFLYCCRWHL